MDDMQEDIDTLKAAVVLIGQAIVFVNEDANAVLKRLADCTDGSLDPGQKADIEAAAMAIEAKAATLVVIAKNLRENLP